MKMFQYKGYCYSKIACVVFISHSNLVEEMFLAMVTKTMISYVLFAFYICNNYVCQYDF
jgi:hypothetical protein